jgi:hypothetical protein
MRRGAVVFTSMQPVRTEQPKRAQVLWGDAGKPVTSTVRVATERLAHYESIAERAAEAMPIGVHRPCHGRAFAGKHVRGPIRADQFRARYAVARPAASRCLSSPRARAE